MIMINISIRPSISLSDDSLNLLVPLKLIRLSFLLNLERFEIFPVRIWMVENDLLRCPHALDVILYSLESLESFEIVVGFPGIVDMRIGLPFDEEAEVSCWLIFRVFD